MSAAATQARYTAHTARHTKPSPVALADYLAGFKARGQGAWPRQKVIAARFGVSVRTIQRWLDQLYAAGLVIVKRSKPHQDHITGRWRRRSNAYRCTFKTKHARPTEKVQLTPTRQECHVIGLFEEPSRGSAPEQVVFPPWEVEGITAKQWTQRQLVSV